MKKILVKNNFEQWLSELYSWDTSVFWNTPKFVQYGYIQEWLKEKFSIWIDCDKNIDSKYSNLEYYTTSKGHKVSGSYDKKLPKAILEALNNLDERRNYILSK